MTIVDHGCVDAVPDAVASLHFDEVSDRSVRVSWAPPERSNGVLTGYTVRWAVKDSPHTVKVKNVSHDTVSLVVQSLQVPPNHFQPKADLALPNLCSTILS